MNRLAHPYSNHSNGYSFIEIDCDKVIPAICERSQPKMKVIPVKRETEIDQASFFKNSLLDLVLNWNPAFTLFTYETVTNQDDIKHK